MQGSSQHSHLGVLCQVGHSNFVPLPKWYREIASQLGRRWNPQRRGDCQGWWCFSMGGNHGKAPARPAGWGQFVGPRLGPVVLTRVGGQAAAALLCSLNSEAGSWPLPAQQGFGVKVWGLQLSEPGLDDIRTTLSRVPGHPHPYSKTYPFTLRP